MLGSIYTIPAMLKTISEIADKSSGRMRKFALFVLNIGVVMIQVGSIVACYVFGLAMSVDEKEILRQAVLTDDLSVTIPRQPLSDNSSTMWELPLALICISLAYWENFVDGDLDIFGKQIRFHSWKKYLHHARSRLYIIASIWKTLWVIAFAMLLQSGFTFNMSYTEQSVSPRLDRNISLTNSNQSHLQINTDFKVDIDENITNPEIFNPFSLTDDIIKHFELYGILYIQLFSVIILTYCGTTACRMCMQLFGFSLPLILTTPLSVAIVILQCMFEFLPTGVYVWISYEEEGNLWILHLAWLLVLWLSEIFITSHIWFPHNGRMEKADRYYILKFVHKYEPGMKESTEWNIKEQCIHQPCLSGHFMILNSAKEYICHRCFCI